MSRRLSARGSSSSSRPFFPPSSIYDDSVIRLLITSSRARLGTRTRLPCARCTQTVHARIHVLPRAHSRPSTSLKGMHRGFCRRLSPSSSFPLFPFSTGYPLARESATHPQAAAFAEVRSTGSAKKSRVFPLCADADARNPEKCWRQCSRISRSNRREIARAFRVTGRSSSSRKNRQRVCCRAREGNVCKLMIAIRVGGRVESMIVARFQLRFDDSAVRSSEFNNPFEHVCTRACAHEIRPLGKWNRAVCLNASPATAGNAFLAHLSIISVIARDGRFVEAAIKRRHARWTFQRACFACACQTSCLRRTIPPKTLVSRADYTRELLIILVRHVERRYTATPRRIRAIGLSRDLRAEISQTRKNIVDEGTRRYSRGRKSRLYYTRASCITRWRQARQYDAKFRAATLISRNKSGFSRQCAEGFVSRFGAFFIWPKNARYASRRNRALVVILRFYAFAYVRDAIKLRIRLTRTRLRKFLGGSRHETKARWIVSA